MKNIYAHKGAHVVVNNNNDLQRKFCVVNNTYEPQSTTVYKGDGATFNLDLKANEILWFEM